MGRTTRCAALLFASLSTTPLVEAWLCNGRNSGSSTSSDVTQLGKGFLLLALTSSIVAAVTDTGSGGATDGLTPELTAAVSLQPSAAPSAKPSRRGSAAPSSAKTVAPTAKPSSQPSAAPSSAKTVAPSAKPSSQPSAAPSLAPSAALSAKPSRHPTGAPSSAITVAPTKKRTGSPTIRPSSQPTVPPTANPTNVSGPGRARPNFLYIMADDLGYGAISLMPGRTNFNITTPNIDAFFQEGMRFTDFYATRNCAPSRGTLMTGKHLGHATLRVNDGITCLGAADVTMLELLRDHGGYETSCIGKWHLSNSTYANNPAGAPWNKGCSRFFAGDPSVVLYPTDQVYRYNKTSGLQESKFPANEGASRTRCMAAGNTCVWLTDLNLEEALSELEHHKTRQDFEASVGLEPAPFVLYLAWAEPHEGYWVKPGISGNPVPSVADFIGEQWPDYEMDHAAAIHSYHDRYVQIVLDKLDALGLRESTVVIYTSDNGAQQSLGPGQHDGAFFAENGPLSGWKEWLQDGGIRVPAAIRWPGKIAAGTVSSEPLALWDMLPTMLDIAGVSQKMWPMDIDGVSFWEGVLQQQPAVGGNTVVSSASFNHPPLYWEACSAAVTRPTWLNQSVAGFARAIRHGRWKGYQPFYAGETSEFLLYDMEADIGETTDVSGRHKTIAARLKALMDAPEMRSSIAGNFNYTIGTDGTCTTWYGAKIA